MCKVPVIFLGILSLLINGPALAQPRGNVIEKINAGYDLLEQGKYDQALAQLRRALPKAKGYKITLNRVCNVDGVCAALRQSTDNFGQDNLEDLIKSNILMVQMAAAGKKNK